MKDMREHIAALATQAAREAAPSLMAHVARSQDGKARLAVMIDAEAAAPGGAITFAARWQAQHTDKDGDALDSVTVDPRQLEMDGVA